MESQRHSSSADNNNGPASHKDGALTILDGDNFTSPRIRAEALFVRGSKR